MTDLDPSMRLADLVESAIMKRSGNQEDHRKLVESVKDTLIREGFIAQFAAKPTEDNTTYAMIDGASIKERTQGMDLICIAMAGMADGFHTYNLEPEDRPFLGWSAVLEADQQYEKQTQAIMMLCEVGILGSLPDYNYRGMDGAYSTSLINLSRTISETDARLIGEFFADEFLGSKAMEGIHALLNPPTAEGCKILGIAKSDSTTAFVEAYRDVVDGKSGSKMEVLKTDRLLASNVLSPGEMFTPLNRHLGGSFKGGLGVSVDALDIPKRGKDRLKEVNDWFIHNNLDNRVYSTYFAPSANAHPGKIMRVDFSLPRPYTELDEDDLLAHADEAVQVVNDDVVSLSFSEPYAQFRVDQFCKDTITGALQQAKSAAEISLYEQDASGVLANNMINSYRT